MNMNFWDEVLAFFCNLGHARFMTFRAGLLLFPNLTQLDMTGPYEVLARIPNAEVHVIGKNAAPVKTEHGLIMLPTTTYADTPPLDLVCIPGGFGVHALLDDAETLEFVRNTAAKARYITSVCTGSLVLGAAGLLRGKRATTHWTSLDFLRDFGADPVAERVVIDGNVITAAGVTAGIDMALRIAAEIAGQQAAERIQLIIEYDPDPPFHAGSPKVAEPALVADMLGTLAPRIAARAEVVRKAAKKLERS